MHVYKMHCSRLGMMGTYLNMILLYVRTSARRVALKTPQREDGRRAMGAPPGRSIVNSTINNSELRCFWSRNSWRRLKRRTRVGRCHRATRQTNTSRDKRCWTMYGRPNFSNFYKNVSCTRHVNSLSPDESLGAVDGACRLTLKQLNGIFANSNSPLIQKCYHRRQERVSIRPRDDCHLPCLRIGYVGCGGCTTREISIFNALRGSCRSTHSIIHTCPSISPCNMAVMRNPQRQQRHVPTRAMRSNTVSIFSTRCHTYRMQYTTTVPWCAALSALHVIPRMATHSRRATYILST